LEKSRRAAAKKRKRYLKENVNADGTTKGSGRTGAAPVYSIAWFRDFMQRPLEDILSKPRSQMSAIEAITTEAVRLAIDSRGEETVVEAIRDAGIARGKGAVSAKEGIRQLLGDSTLARFLSSPEDRLKAIKHLHSYQLGQAPSTLDLKNNGGSFEAPINGPLDVEVVLTRPDGTHEKLRRLDQMPPHPETVEEAAEREAQELEEIEGPIADQEREDAKPFDACDPTKPEGPY
jgi:hypothetical protein